MPLFNFVTRVVDIIHVNEYNILLATTRACIRLHYNNMLFEDLCRTSKDGRYGGENHLLSPSRPKYYQQGFGQAHVMRYNVLSWLPRLPIVTEEFVRPDIFNIINEPYPITVVFPQVKTLVEESIMKCNLIFFVRLVVQYSVSLRAPCSRFSLFIVTCVII